VQPNIRGSTGYGKKYAHLDDKDKREDSIADLAAINAWLRTRPDVDPARIAVMGGSYGGYATLASITLYPEIWAAACDIVGIANFRTFLEKTAPYRRALREAEYGALDKEGDLLDKISPIHKVDRIKSPLFVIHGTNDPRVPVQEAEQIVEALKKRNVRVEYMKFDNEGHGLVRRENRIKAYGALTTFFDEVMK
jgi:dipeptidyl aminopeptidase/acylaminoacyl peptidase